MQFELHSKQSLAFSSDATEILYGGAAGGGKSHLLRVVAVSMALQVPHIQVYLIRRLGVDLAQNHVYSETGLLNMLAPLIKKRLVRFNSVTNTFSFANGARIWLQHCQHEKDKLSYQGKEIHVALFDELTHFTQSIYSFIRSRLRLGGLKVPPCLKGKLPLVISGANPGGVGHNWVKREFVKGVKPGEIRRMSSAQGGMLRQYIPARLSDNPSIDQEDYAAKLSGLGNPALVKAMLNGDWNIVAGGAVDDVFNTDFNVIPRFATPKEWRHDTCFDWGSSTPFYCGWCAMANGEEVPNIDGNGRDFCPADGSIIIIQEYYGAKAVGTNEGLKLSAEDVARNIYNISDSLFSNHWLGSKVAHGVADGQIFNVTEKGSGSIAKIMARATKHRSNGPLLWRKANKSPGTRKLKLEIMRAMLKNAATGEGPGLYIMDHCTDTIELLQTLVRDEKDTETVSKECEDHAFDAIGYRLLDIFHPPPNNFAVTFPD